MVNKYKTVDIEPPSLHHIIDLPLKKKNNNKEKEKKKVGIVMQVLKTDVFYGFFFYDEESRKKFTSSEKIITLIGIFSVSLAVNTILEGSQKLDYYVCECTKQDDYMNQSISLDNKLMDEKVLNLFKENCPLIEESGEMITDFNVKACCHRYMWEFNWDDEFLETYEPCEKPRFFIDEHEQFSQEWFLQQVYQSAIVGVLSFFSLILLVGYVLKLKCNYCNQVMYFIVFCQMIIACITSYVFITTGPKSYFIDVIMNVGISYVITILVLNPINGMIQKRLCKDFGC